MQKHQRRINLLCRLGRMREVEKQDAAMRVAEAQGVHSKLLLLGERSGEIAASYATRGDARTGGELARQLGFMSGLDDIVRETEAERTKAEKSSEQAMQHLVRAERRLEKTGEWLGTERRAKERVLQARENSMNPVLARKLNSKG